MLSQMSRSLNSRTLEGVMNETRLWKPFGGVEELFTAVALSTRQMDSLGRRRRESIGVMQQRNDK